MAEAIGVAGSIVGIVSFGLQFATTLQTYVEAVAESEKHLQDIAFDVNATASALNQLHIIVEIRDDATKGTEEVVRLAHKCEEVYNAIIVLLLKAGDRQDKPTTRGTADDVKLGMLQITSLSRKLRWPWLEPRIKRLQEDLRWLKMSLLLQLQLAQLAKLHSLAPEKREGSHDEEEALRDIVRIMIDRRRKFTGEVAWRRKVGGKAVKSRIPTQSAQAATESHARYTLSKGHSRFIMPVDSSRSSTQSSFDSNSTGRPSRPRPFIEEEQVPNGTSPDIEPREPTIPPLETSDGQENIAPGNNMITSAVVSPLMTESLPVPLNNPARGLVANTTIETAEQNARSDLEVPPEPTFGTSLNASAKAAKHSQARQKHSPKDPPRAHVSVLRNLFKKHSPPPLNVQDKELVAYLIEDNLSGPRKLPFNNEQLAEKLSQELKERSGKQDVSAQYLSLTQEQRNSVDTATIVVKRSTPREVTCLAITKIQSTENNLLLFFSLGTEVAPVRLQVTGGEMIQFPYEHCRTWERIMDLIIEVYPTVSMREYDLLGPENQVIVPTTLASSIQPGWHIRLQPRNRSDGPAALAPRLINQHMVVPSSPQMRGSPRQQYRSEYSRSETTSPPPARGHSRYRYRSRNERGRDRSDSAHSREPRPRIHRSPSLNRLVGNRVLPNETVLRETVITTGPRNTTFSTTDSVSSSPGIRRQASRRVEIASEEEIDIVDFEKEQEETAELGLDDLLGNWAA